MRRNPGFHLLHPQKGGSQAEQPQSPRWGGENAVRIQRGQRPVVFLLLLRNLPPFGVPFVHLCDKLGRLKHQPGPPDLRAWNKLVRFVFVHFSRGVPLPPLPIPPQKKEDAKKKTQQKDKKGPAKAGTPSWGAPKSARGSRAAAHQRAGRRQVQAPRRSQDEGRGPEALLAQAAYRGAWEPCHLAMGQHDFLRGTPSSLGSRNLEMEGFTSSALYKGCFIKAPFEGSFIRNLYKTFKKPFL